MGNGHLAMGNGMLRCKRPGGGRPQDPGRTVWPRHGDRIGSHRAAVLRGGDAVIRSAAVGQEAINPSFYWTWVPNVFVGGTLSGEEPVVFLQNRDFC